MKNKTQLKIVIALVLLATALFSVAIYQNDFKYQSSEYDFCTDGISSIVFLTEMNMFPNFNTEEEAKLFTDTYNKNIEHCGFKFILD